MAVRYPSWIKRRYVRGLVFAVLVLITKTDPAHWENIRTLPEPPEFVLNLPMPSPRTLHFTKDNQLIVSYLDHGLA